MKKLMIATAIVCAAAASQAASFTWNSSQTAFSIDPAEFTAGLVNGKVYSAATTMDMANTMQGQASSSAQNIKWSMIMTITDANGSVTLDPYSITSYNSGAKPKSATDALSSSKVFKPATDSDPACVISWSVIYEGKYTDGSGNEWTLTSNALANSGEFGSNDDLKLVTKTAPSTWTATTSAVPEPTSGLLLLLGVAGLALRRRRA